MPQKALFWKHLQFSPLLTSHRKTHYIVLFLPAATWKYSAKSEAVMFWKTVLGFSWSEQSTGVHSLKSEPKLCFPDELHRMTISAQSALILSHITCCTESPISQGQVKATFPPGLVNLELFCFPDTSKASVEKRKTQQKPAYNSFRKV